MMKKLALILSLTVISIGFSQNTKDVGTFNKVSVFDQIRITLVESPTGSNTIEIKGSDADNVNVINKNGHLKIKMNFVNSFQGDDIKITLYHNGINEINAGEGSTVRSNETLNAVAMDLQAKTGALIDIEVETDRLNITAGAGSVIKVTGQASVQNIVSNSGADVQNKDLKTKQTTVTVNAGGKASVQASDLVDAKTRAGGNIYIYGDPKVINQKNIAGGVIKKVK